MPFQQWNDIFINERRFALSLFQNFAKILHYEDMHNAHAWLYTCYLAEYHSLGVGNLCVFVVWVFGDTLEQIC